MFSIISLQIEIVNRIFKLYRDKQKERVILVSFANVLIKLMETNNLSAYQVYKDTGISDSLIGYWRREEKQPTKINIEKLADYFGVSTDCLLDREDKKPADIEVSAGNDPKIMNKLKQLNQRGIDKVDAYIDGLLTNDDYCNDAAREATAQNKSA